MRKERTLHPKDTSFSLFDFSCMRRAFTLARRGVGKTSPNPMVGAVLVKKGRVIGEGYHRRYGDIHAEAMAIQAALKAGHSPAGADLYCTLEPCCFTSKEKHQAPCTEAVITSGITRVFIANKDPYPKVSGKGTAALEKAGIHVRTGLLAETGEELNRGFFTYHRLDRPFIHLKIAQTLDGRIAAPDGGARWISNEASRTLVHRLRGFYDAVLIGRGTALADDPELTVRLAKGRNPLRVILDSRLALPESAKLFHMSDPEKTIVIHREDADKRKAGTLRSRGAELIPLPPSAVPAAGGLPLADVFSILGKRGVRSVLVEGGSEIFTSFLREGLWDRLSVFIAPIILGGGAAAVSGLGASSMTEALRPGDGSWRRVGSQILFETDNKNHSRSKRLVCSQE